MLNFKLNKELVFKVKGQRGAALRYAITANKDTYGETDPDIDELLTYLDALRSQ